MLFNFTGLVSTRIEPMSSFNKSELGGHHINACYEQLTRERLVSFLQSTDNRNNTNEDQVRCKYLFPIENTDNNVHLILKMFNQSARLLADEEFGPTFKCSSLSKARTIDLFATYTRSVWSHFDEFSGYINIMKPRINDPRQCYPAPHAFGQIALYSSQDADEIYELQQYGIVYRDQDFIIQPPNSLGPDCYGFDPRSRSIPVQLDIVKDLLASSDSISWDGLYFDCSSNHRINTIDHDNVPAWQPVSDTNLSHKDCYIGHLYVDAIRHNPSLLMHGGKNIKYWKTVDRCNLHSRYHDAYRVEVPPIVKHRCLHLNTDTVKYDSIDSKIYKYDKLAERRFLNLHSILDKYFACQTALPESMQNQRLPRVAQNLRFRDKLAKIAKDGAECTAMQTQVMAEAKRFKDAVNEYTKYTQNCERLRAIWSSGEKYESFLSSILSSGYCPTLSPLFEHTYLLYNYTRLAEFVRSITSN